MLLGLSLYFKVPLMEGGVPLSDALGDTCKACTFVYFWTAVGGVLYEL